MSMTIALKGLHAITNTLNYFATNMTKVYVRPTEQRAFQYMSTVTDQKLQVLALSSRGRRWHSRKRTVKVSPGNSIQYLVHFVLWRPLIKPSQHQDREIQFSDYYYTLYEHTQRIRDGEKMNNEQ